MDKFDERASRVLSERFIPIDQLEADNSPHAAANKLRQSCLATTDEMLSGVAMHNWKVR